MPVEHVVAIAADQRVATRGACDQRIVACATVERIAARGAARVEQIGAAVADERVRLIAAGQRVAAVAAGERVILSVETGKVAADIAGGGNIAAIEQEIVGRKIAWVHPAQSQDGDKVVSGTTRVGQKQRVAGSVRDQTQIIVAERIAVEIIAGVLILDGLPERRQVDDVAAGSGLKIGDRVGIRRTSEAAAIIGDPAKAVGIGKGAAGQRIGGKIVPIGNIEKGVASGAGAAVHRHSAAALRSAVRAPAPPITVSP